jgi:hypothetical protein
VSADDGELGRTTETLRLCRLELAQVRADLEPVMEELARERFRADEAESALAQVAEQLDVVLHGLPQGSALHDRVRRAAVRYRRAHSDVWRDVELVRASELFSAAWYVRHYPETLGSGLSPVLHYLLHGAAEGKDPGPGFSTERYLAEHPDLDPATTNPLVHHLTR